MQYMCQIFTPCIKITLQNFLVNQGLPVKVYIFVIQIHQILLI